MKSTSISRFKRRLAVVLIISLAAITLILGVAFFLINTGHVSGSDGNKPNTRVAADAVAGERPPTHPHEADEFRQPPPPEMERDITKHPVFIMRRRVILISFLSILLLIYAGALLDWLTTASALDQTAERLCRFTGDVAHELKTPLAVMQSIVEHAVRHADGNETAEQLGSDLMEEIGRLKGVVQRLLLLTQSDAGQLSLPHEDVDLSALARLLADDLSLFANEGEVNTTIADGLHVTASREFLTQAFQNLLSNAAQYNREGFTIEFTLAKVGSSAVITVSNGIDPLLPPDMNRIFDRFYRGVAPRGSKHEGSGLGLNIAKEIIETSGGSISAVIEGERIVFRAALPLRKVRAQ